VTIAVGSRGAPPEKEKIHTNNNKYQFSPSKYFHKMSAMSL
jgi:hypothetical protein